MNQPQATHIRYLIIVMAMLAAVLLYLERVCVSVAEVYIREDLRIGKMEMDAAFGAFFIAYALAQVPSGWLSQRYGPRAMMALYMLGWSIFGVFIAIAQDVYTLIAARFLLGLSQAGAYPTAALLVKRWVPDRSRGLASSIVAFGGRFGGAGANWLTGILIVAFVPITVPATITSKDILSLDPIVKLREKATTESMMAPEAMPTDLASYKARVTATLNRSDLGSPIDPAKLVESINTIIRDPDYTSHLNNSSATLAQDGQDLLKKPAAERTEAEKERLNRLMFEKAIPGVFMQLHGGGWRPALLTYGVLGVVVGALFWLFARNWPREHPWANEAEVELIESGQSKIGETAAPAGIPLAELLTSGNQWLFSTVNFFSNVGWVFLISLLPRFLDERYGVPVDVRGQMTTIPLFVASFSMIVGGWATDKLTVLFGRRLGRSLPVGVGKVPCIIAMCTIPFLSDPWHVVAALTVTAVFQDFGIPAVWAFAQDTGGKQAATVLGWGNMWGNLGAGLAIITTGQIADKFGWNAAFYMLAGAFALCGIAGTLMNANHLLFGPPKEEQ